MYRIVLLSLVIGLTSVLAISPLAANELFPFVVSYELGTSSANISTWLPAPAGANGPVRIADGQFATDQGRVKFWGANLCFEACFPEKVSAERLARRLASLGINCVRMHHMDARNIWGKSDNKTIIDPDQLRRLDYLIYQLKLRGIYTNLNLHVSRTLGEAEGFSKEDERPKYDKGLDNFEPRMIELQKKYARDLLTHVNSYTGQPYTKDPAIAFVEISNENALYHSWHRGSLTNLPDPYRAEFRRQWVSWLRRKYGTTEVLRETWRVGEVPLGDSMLENGFFAEPFETGWSMERDREDQVDWKISRSGPTGGRSLTVDVQAAGSVSWRPQFSHTGFALKKGKPYTLSFCANSETPQQISVHTMMKHDPWRRLGFSVQVDLQPRWKQYRHVFVASEDCIDARLTFSQLKPGAYRFAGVSLRPGGVLGLRTYESLQGDRVPPMFPGRIDRTPAARRDFAQFLWDTECAYWSGMYRYLKEDLGVQALISGTQLGYSPVHIQAGLDYLDAHAYWQHPSFPGRPWDRNNWNIRNVAMVNNPGAKLASLAARRVLEKPYTISEYNDPVPNSYGAEGFPMIAAFGGHQSWDGIYIFAYSHNNDHEPQMVSSYFDIKADPTRVVHMPACHALFVRGDVAGAAETLSAPIPQPAGFDMLAETFDPGSLVTDSFGIDSQMSLQHAIGVTLEGPHQGVRKVGIALNDARRFESDTSQLSWDLSHGVGGCLLVNTPRTKVFTGFVDGGASYDLGDVRLRIGSTRLGWATVSMVCLDGDRFSAPGRILVAATGWMQNSNARLEQLEDDRVTLGARWGNAPVLCEGIPATISLPLSDTRVQCYPLSEAGKRRAAISTTRSGDRVLVELSPAHKTLWYEIVIEQ